ncbi:hypothetical protein DPEC_G00141880 [Dallia pectoralis]|uniref:Uncharacterized protein n=1 Tax=Dallia pectoralis TaxID=75939 RepID=A0ACC2GMJ6_DALPE|nr:hypothetical protein DPEC_G00141880 [Dallia pectoralis]
MKMQYVSAGLAVLASVALLGLIHVRKKEELKEQNHTSFESTKLRVTYDVLREYRHEVIRAQNLVEKTKALVDSLGSELSQTQAKQTQQKGELDGCQGKKKQTFDSIAALEGEITSAKDEFEKQKVVWAAQVASHKQQAEERSKVCDFVKKDSVDGRKMCGDAPPKQDAAAKADAPKPDAPQPDAPKPDAPQPEAPKQDAPKPDAPKPDAPKQDAPKPDAPKPDAPKPDAPKPDAPKPDAPKPDAPAVKK